MTYTQCTAESSKLWIFIHFYYSQIMRTFSQRFCYSKLFLTIMMSRLNSSNHLPKLYKAPNQSVTGKYVLVISSKTHLSYIRGNVHVRNRIYWCYYGRNRARYLTPIR